MRQAAGQAVPATSSTTDAVALCGEVVRARVVVDEFLGVVNASLNGLLNNFPAILVADKL
jgi:hypothetical protein